MRDTAGNPRMSFHCFHILILDSRPKVKSVWKLIEQKRSEEREHDQNGLSKYKFVSYLRPSKSSLEYNKSYTGEQTIKKPVSQMTPSLPKLANVRLKTYSAKGEGAQMEQGRHRYIAAICAHEDMYDTKEDRHALQQSAITEQ